MIIFLQLSNAKELGDGLKGGHTASLIAAAAESLLKIGPF